MAAIVAKKAILEEEIIIVNCDKSIVTGDKKEILANYKKKSKRGAPKTGPYIPRNSEKFVKRTIRGMIPYKQPKGREAFKRVMCYVGLPEEFKDKTLETIEKANISKMKNLKFLTVREICFYLGGKL